MEEVNSDFIGNIGVAVTPLRMVGLVRLGNRVIDAESRHEPIEIGELVIVTGVLMQRLIVEKHW